MKARYTQRIVCRRGFTLIELLVSMGIVAVLIALLLPAIQQARETSRRVECTNNLHNIGIAMIASSESRRRLPASGNFGEKEFHGWVVEILAWLDQPALHERWDYDAGYNETSNQELGQLSLKILVCPSDLTAVDGRGNLSYAVNGGVAWTEPVDCPVVMRATGPNPVGAAPIDLNGNGIVCGLDPSLDGDLSDTKLMYRMGLFFPENWPKGTGTVRHHTTDSIVDGLSNTIMIAECVRSGYDPNEPDKSGWATPLAWRNSFFMSGYICKDLNCSEGNVDYSLANAQSHPLARYEALNSGRTQAEGQAPWPTSMHTSGVLMLFADGRVQPISEGIAGEVYAALMTPQGTLIEGPLRQPIVSDPSD